MRGVIRIEAILYGVWAVTGGAVVGIALTRALFNNVSGLQAIPWQTPWESTVGSMATAVCLCLVSAAIPMRRITTME